MEPNQPRLTMKSLRRDPWWWLLLAVLMISAGLRGWLVARGGQLLWSDETRYYASREAVARLAEHDYTAFARELLGGADHLFFKVLGLVPAGLEHYAGTNNVLAGCFFAGFSVLNILLVWCIARSAGAASREAAVAAALMAGAATHFYYARHFFPYDAALSFGLLALWTGWSGRGGPGRSLSCGVLVALAFLTYTGAWLFGAMVLLGHVLLAWPDGRRAAGRAGWAGAGLVLPIALVIGLARLLVNVDLVASFLYFSRTINQGDFGRGWKLLLDYFWSAEGPNLVLGVVGLLLVVAGARAARSWNYGLCWVAGAVFLVAGLLVPSDVWPKFVIYGRTAREIVPLVCLASAFALERLWRTGGRTAGLASVVTGLALFQTVANFWTPLHQVFPPEFHRQASLFRDQLRQRGEKRQLVILYANMVAGKASLLDALPDHDVLLAEPHPMQYRPYLFEGLGEETRALLGQEDIRMRLIAVNHARLDHPSDLRRPYPGAVRLTLRMPDNRVPGVPEPLLVTGETRHGDFIYLIYQADSTLRIGFDHWDFPGMVSDPVPVDFNQPVVITLSTGPLHGDPPDVVGGIPAGDPRGWLYVEINGRVVWSQPASFHAAPPDSISYLANYIGGSTAGKKFSGKVLMVQSWPLPPFAAGRPEGRRP
jgi:hypothetical protein